MIQGRTMSAVSAACLALLALSSTGCAKPQPIASAEAACDIATQKVTELRGLPTSHVAHCEKLGEANGYYPLALYAHCKEAVCGSTSMGWFAVGKTTGEVFEWDVTALRAGPRLKEQISRALARSAGFDAESCQWKLGRQTSAVPAHYLTPTGSGRRTIAAHRPCGQRAAAARSAPIARPPAGSPLPG